MCMTQSVRKYQFWRLHFFGAGQGGAGRGGRGNVVKRVEPSQASYVSSIRSIEVFDLHFN